MILVANPSPLPPDLRSVVHTLIHLFVRSLIQSSAPPPSLFIVINSGTVITAFHDTTTAWRARVAMAATIVAIMCGAGDCAAFASFADDSQTIWNS